jgi:ubiquinone/menaquinone biosynthesis C-methylase UbiE
MPLGTERFLDNRTLAGDHRTLAALLRPGMRVLDVGCGSGAITRGIAQYVQPGGSVLGIDTNAELIALAAEASEHLPNLALNITDIRHLGAAGDFDVVTAARVLQWLPDPEAALSEMVRATRPGGLVVVLDYNHSQSEWRPQPPPTFQRFYRQFLSWRAEAGMDNQMADHLPEMFAAAGLIDVSSIPEDEIATRGEEDFEVRMALWAEVIATRGHQLVADGALTEAERAGAEHDLREWIGKSAQRQTLRLKAIVGTRSRG